MATRKFKTTYVTHTWFLLHCTALKHGTQGRRLGCAEPGEDLGDGVNRGGTEISAVMRANVFTNRLTAILLGLTIIKIVPPLPHLGFIFLVMDKIFPGNPRKGSMETYKNGHKFSPVHGEVESISASLPLIWLTMSLALANATLANMTQDEVWKIIVHWSLPILADLGTSLPWEEALTPINGLPVSTLFACDFEALPINRWSQFCQSLNPSCLYDLIWSMECNRIKVVPILNLALKRLSKLLLFLLCSASCQLNKPELPCWRMKGHEGQSQVSSVLPAEAIQKEPYPSRATEGRFISKPNKDQTNWVQSNRTARSICRLVS